MKKQIKKHSLTWDKLDAASRMIARRPSLLWEVQYLSETEIRELRSLFTQIHKLAKRYDEICGYLRIRFNDDK